VFVLQAIVKEAPKVKLCERCAAVHVVKVLAEGLALRELCELLGNCTLSRYW
jgi:hypothetical protein